MKKILVSVLLVLPIASCKTFGALLDVPAAAVADVGSVVATVTPSETAVAETAGQVASTGATVLTGNPAIGAAAGALVTGLAAFFLSRRKKQTA